MEQLNSIINGLAETSCDAAGLHGVLAMMHCVFTGDEPSDHTMADAFYWLCKQVEHLEKDIDATCVELSDMREVLESRND